MNQGQQAYLKCGVVGKAVQLRELEERLTLNTNVNVILRLLGLSCVFVGLGEGVYICLVSWWIRRYMGHS